MTISYAITCCNEIEELKYLLEWITKKFRQEDEIVVLMDSQSVTKEVKDFLDHINVELEFKKIQFHKISHPLNKDFASFKNFLKQHCSKDYIFFIDADEYPTPMLQDNLPSIIELNNVDVILVPRINTVEDITDEDMKRWGWQFVNGQKWINWPDFQWRLCRNSPEIKWEGKVHEKLVGYKTLSQLPYNVAIYCLHHPKRIERQRKQNEFYETL